MKQNKSRQGIKQQLNTAVSKGFKILKTRSEEALQAAKRTAHLLKKEVKIHAIQSRIADLHGRFGNEVHKAMRSGSARIMPVLKRIKTDLGKLEHILQEAQKDVKHAAGAGKTLKRAAKRKPNA